MIVTPRAGVYLPPHLRVLLLRAGGPACAFRRLPLRTHLSSWPLCFPGKTRTKDKYRVVYTDHQRLELEKEFHYSRYITIRRKSELAANLGLTERQVCGTPTSATGAALGVWPPGCQADYGAQSKEENREVEPPGHGHTAQQKLSYCQNLSYLNKTQYP